MTRRISITEIPDVMEDAIVFLVAATTLEWTARVKKATPVRVIYEGEPKGEGGDLRAAWQTDIKPTTGTVTNILPYAEPVCFGVNLPPSWQGRYRTRQNTRAGFPEIIGKELEAYVMKQIRRGI